MKTLEEYIKENMEIPTITGNEGFGIFKKETEEEEKDATQESIKDEKDFRDYARNKFQIVFGDKLDEKKMKDTIDGLLFDNKELVDKGDWGELVGMLNKSFGA